MTASMGSAFAATQVANADALRQKLGLNAYAPGASLANIKIAILDNGFDGYLPGQGMLPDSTEVIEGPQNPEAPTNHGLGMAQIVWAMTGKAAAGPKFYLVNTNGFSNLKAAVDFVIKQGVDVVLYSEVWSFGSNFDGSGFINALVNKATSAGILWINAAGNYGGMVYNSAVIGHAEDLRFENRLDDNDLNVTLSWTDFSEDENYHATKDLDLFVYDDSDKLVASSELIQHGEAPPTDGTPSQLSGLARESISLRGLDRGTYHIKVVAKSDNFTATDHLRVLIKTERPGSVLFTDHTNGFEIMPPADNPNVFTVGERSDVSSAGPTLDGRNKPDALVDDATVSFTNGDQTRGSSNAAAMVAGAVVMMKADSAKWDFKTLSTYASELRVVSTTADLRPINLNLVNPAVIAMIPRGGTLMIHTNGHLVILSPVDPLELPVFKNAGAYRLNPDDVLAVNVVQNRWYGFTPAQEPYIMAPMIEFREYQTGVWMTPPPTSGAPATE